MENNIIPKKLKKGDEIRIISPSASLCHFEKENLQKSEDLLTEMGFKITYGKHACDLGVLDSSSVETRLTDFHEAFLDDSVKGIICGFGGTSANDLIDKIDYDIVKNNPKIFCGFSDITVIQNAILSQTNLITYSGLIFTFFENESKNSYPMQSFNDCLIKSGNYNINPSDFSLEKDGYYIINEGEAEGIIVGGNIESLSLLQGTGMMPSFENSIVFLEDCTENDPDYKFSMRLQSLIQQPGFKNIKGLVIGRFIEERMPKKVIADVIKLKPELDNIPVISEVDFGHRGPMVTFPIGGRVKILAKDNDIKITIQEH